MTGMKHTCRACFFQGQCLILDTCLVFIIKHLSHLARMLVLLKGNAVQKGRIKKSSLFYIPVMETNLHHSTCIIHSILFLIQCIQPMMNHLLGTKKGPDHNWFIYAHQLFNQIKAVLNFVVSFFQYLLLYGVLLSVTPDKICLSYCIETRTRVFDFIILHWSFQFSNIKRPHSASTIKLIM